MKPLKTAADLLREAKSGSASELIREAIQADSSASRLKAEMIGAGMAKSQSLAGIARVLETFDPFPAPMIGLAPPAATSAQPRPAARPAPVESAADLGGLVRAARRRMGLNQQAFAELAGVGRRFVSELEGGKATLEIGKVIQVCRAAGVDLFAAPRS